MYDEQLTGGDSPMPLVSLHREVCDLVEGENGCSENLGLLPERVRRAIGETISRVLLDSGVDRETVQDSVDSLVELLGQRVNSVVELRREVTQIYRLHTADLAWENPSIQIIHRTLQDDAELRIALRALQSSPGYTRLREERVWALSSGLELRDTLVAEGCSTEGTNWYMILCRIMRHRYPRAMTGTGWISVPVLRNFLCDYVFCVPRELVIRRKRISTTRKPSEGRKRGMASGPTSCRQKRVVVPIPSKRFKEPSPEDRRFVRPDELFVFDAFYGWDEEKGTFTGTPKTVEQIAEELRMGEGMIQELLQKAQVRALPPDETFAQEEPEVMELADEPEEVGELGDDRGLEEESELEPEVIMPATLRDPHRRRGAMAPLPHRERPQPTLTHQNPVDIPPECLSPLPPAPEPVKEHKVPIQVVREPKAPVKIGPILRFPKNLGYQESLEWLRNEPSVQVGLQAVQRLPEYKHDPMAMTLAFREHCPILGEAFSDLQKRFGHPWKTILHDIFFPDPLILLQRDNVLIGRLQECFALHKNGNHEEFFRTIRSILQEGNLFNVIAIICDGKEEDTETSPNGGDEISPLEAAALIAGVDWRLEDTEMYESVSLRETLGNLLRDVSGFSIIRQKVLAGNIGHVELEKLLQATRIRVPLGRTSWPRYMGASTQESNLFIVIQELIRTDRGYKHGDEKSQKHLLGKLQALFE